MKLPKNILPSFIGKLIELQKAYVEDSPEWSLLWRYVGQCRNYNEYPDDLAGRGRLWDGMEDSRTLLAGHGITV